MFWLYILGGIAVAIVVVSAVWIWLTPTRHVDMVSGETIFGAPPRPDPPPFFESAYEPVTDENIAFAAHAMEDLYGASAEFHAAEKAKLTPDRREREIWLRIEREIVVRRANRRDRVEYYGG